MNNVSEVKIVTNVTKPTTNRGRAGKGSTKYPFGKMAVGMAFKVNFTSEANRLKEERRVRTAVLHFENTNADPHIQFETFTVTAESEPNKDFPGAGIWVRRIADHTDESLEKRNTMRAKMRVARVKKDETVSGDNSAN